MAGVFSAWISYRGVRARVSIGDSDHENYVTVAVETDPRQGGEKTLPWSGDIRAPDAPDPPPMRPREEAE